MLDVESLSFIFRQRHNQFVAFAFSYTRDHNIAEDMFMDSIAALWQNRTSFPEGSNYPALLLTILRNKCLDYLKHQQLKARIGKNLTCQYQKELELRILTLQSTNPDNIFSSEIQRIIDRTLSELPKQTKLIFELSRYENRKNTEIAKELGISIKTVEYHLSKCLKVLRISLRDYLKIFLLLNLF